MPEFGLLLTASYLIGSIPMAYLVVKWRYGVDIRKYGSGQVGGSNVFRNFSKKLGVVVFLYDFIKGILMVGIAQLLGMDIALQMAIGLAVVIGHNWPVFLRFNAGRGVATTVGIGLFLLPLGIPGFIFCALFTLFIGSSPLPLIFAIASLPITSAVLHEPQALTLGLTVLFLLLIIRRLTAPRTAESFSVSTRELLLNRLLFDRDIRDANAWMNRRPDKRPQDDKSKKSDTSRRK